MTRRQVLLGAAAAGGALWLPSRLLGGETKLPSSTLNMACIGIGDMGWGDIQNFSGENIVAVCDVDETHLNRAGAAFPEARQFKDYRRLFDKMGRDIDAVCRFGLMRNDREERR